MLKAAYCGPDWGVVTGSAGVAGVVFMCVPGSALRDTGVKDAACVTGSVVIALSGFKR